MTTTPPVDTPATTATTSTATTHGRRRKRPSGTFGTWFPAFCPCGRPITQAVRDASGRLRGRPRVTRSDICLRRRQRALRQLRLRQQWLDQLLQLARTDDQLRAPDLADQLDALLSDIAEARTLVVRDDPELTRRQS